MRLTSVCSRLLKMGTLDSEKEVLMKAPWGRLTGLSWGDPSNPPVLLCHGRLDACSSFRPLVRHLPQDYYYVSVDLPGNGRSDHYPKGRLVLTDFLPALETVRDHFKWEQFIFVGHSLGAVLGKFFNHLYPGQISRLVVLDPQPAYVPSLKDMKRWYQGSYDGVFFGDELYDRMNAGPETAPTYTYEEARLKLMAARGLTEETADIILERSLEKMPDGLYRYTFDQRFKKFMLLPFLGDSLQEFYTNSATPTLGVFASESISRGIYREFPFALDDSAWKNKNYAHYVVESGHDVHITQSEIIAGYITEFMSGKK